MIKMYYSSLLDAASLRNASSKEPVRTPRRVASKFRVWTAMSGRDPTVAKKAGAEGRSAATTDRGPRKATAALKPGLAKEQP